MSYSYSAMLVNIIASSIFAFFGTIGNALVIFAFFKVRSLRTINNMFVVQLAFVDLMKASIILTTKSVHQAKQVTSMNEVFCQISGMLRVIGSCQSAVLLGAIAVVRYFKVVKPRLFEKIFTFNKTLIYCCSIFFATLLLSLLPVIGLGKFRFSKFHGACFVNWDKINIPFRSIYYMFNVGITFPVLIFCYYNIFKKLREHSRSVIPRINKKSKSTVTAPKIEVTKANSKRGNGEKYKTEMPDNDTNDQPATESASHLQVTGGDPAKKEGLQKKTYKVRIKKAKAWFRLRREKSDVELEVTRIMFAIVVVYICCWMPAAIVNIMNLSKVVAIPGDVLLLIVTLVDLKVCLNPLIYGIASKQFRNAFLAVLLRKRVEETVSMSGLGSSSKAPSNDNSFQDSKGMTGSASFDSSCDEKKATCDYSSVDAKATCV